MNEPALEGQNNERLLLSIHDVGPRFEREVDMLHDLFVGLTGKQRFAMLVAGASARLLQTAARLGGSGGRDFRSWLVPSR